MKTKKSSKKLISTQFNSMEEKAIKFYGVESDAKKTSSIFFESEFRT